MIATDTSSLVAFLQGAAGADVETLGVVATAGQLVLPPLVLTEILTDSVSAKLLESLANLQMLSITDGYWRRAGLSRQTLRLLGLKAKIGDALIAQSCIDHGVALITRDGDFRHFAAHCGLKLA